MSIYASALLSALFCFIAIDIHAQTSQKAGGIDLSSEAPSEAQLMKLSSAERNAYNAGLRDGLRGIAIGLGAVSRDQAERYLKGLLACAQLTPKEGSAALMLAHGRLAKSPSDLAFSAVPIAIAECAMRDTFTANSAIAGTPQALIAFSGSGDKSTAKFTISQTEWRIHWRATPSGSTNGVLAVRIVAADGRSVAAFRAPEVGGDDYYYVRTPAGSYYLEINSIFMQYVITVEQ